MTTTNLIAWNYYFEYFNILILLIIGIILGLILILLSVAFASDKGDAEKLSAFECGFEPFDETKGKFEIHFYLVGILFIIFDLEIALLFPWAVSFSSLGYFGFFSVTGFLLILTLGFVYEWKKGALDWNLG